jgi:hypothetical protein
VTEFPDESRIWVAGGAAPSLSNFAGGSIFSSLLRSCNRSPTSELDRIPSFLHLAIRLYLDHRFSFAVASGLMPIALSRKSIVDNIDGFS